VKSITFRLQFYYLRGTKAVCGHSLLIFGELFAGNIVFKEAMIYN